jgi:hypothetical protein
MTTKLDFDRILMERNLEVYFQLERFKKHKEDLLKMRQYHEKQELNHPYRDR